MVLFVGDWGSRHPASKRNLGFGLRDLRNHHSFVYNVINAAHSEQFAKVRRLFPSTQHQPTATRTQSQRNLICNTGANLVKSAQIDAVAAAVAVAVESQPIWLRVFLAKPEKLARIHDDNEEGWLVVRTKEPLKSHGNGHICTPLASPLCVAGRPAAAAATGGCSHRRGRRRAA